jgi:hypothetical protein
MVTHCASRYGGQLVMAERTNINENEVVCCLDVKDSVMIAQRERLKPMLSLIKQAVEGHFPGVTVEELQYQPPIFENGLHKQYLRIKEEKQMPRSWSKLIGEGR